MAHSKRPNRTTHPNSAKYRAAIAAWNKAHEVKNSEGTTAKERVDAKQKARDEARKPKPTPKPKPKTTPKTTPKPKGKVTGKGPVASGTEYGVFLDEVAKNKKEKLKAKKPEVKKPEVKKPAKKMSRLEKQNRARHSDEAIDHLKTKNAAFQAMKKGKMTKKEFIKKFPNSITAQKAAGLRRR